MRIRTVLLISLAGLAVAAAGCSGDETTTTSTPSGSTTTGGAGGATGGSGGVVGGAGGVTGGAGGVEGGAGGAIGGTGGVAGGAGGAEGGAGGATGGAGGAVGGAGGATGGAGGSGGAGGNTCPTWYADADGDTYGDPDVTLQQCDQPDGYVDNADDCDDDDESVHPGALEQCDGKDNDCDSDTSEDGLVSFEQDNYDTIQAALDAAEAAGGGTIYVCAGTYEENLTIATDVTVIGISGAELTIVQPASGMESTRVATVEDGLTVMLDGLTLRGASPADNGGGLWASTGGDTQVLRCIVQDNDGANGGGIYLQDGQLSVIDSTLELNTATNDGGALAAAAGTVFLDGIDATTIVRQNSAARGGGVAVVRSVAATGADIYFHATVVTDNSATTDGGGVYLEGTDAAGGDPTLNASFLGTTIGGAAAEEGNSAGRGGGLAVLTSAALTFDALSSISFNEASTNGGGVALDGTVTMAGAEDDMPLVSHNHASVSAGGISIHGESVLSYLTVASNSSDSRGGGLDVSQDQDEASVELYDVVIQDNQAGNESSGEGGAIALSLGRLILTDCQVLDNRGVTGAGLVLQSDCDVSMVGGAMLHNGWDLDPDDLGNGAWVKSGSGVLHVFGSDWGTAATDNMPFDVWVVAGSTHGYTGFGANSTFVCTNSSCG